MKTKITVDELYSALKIVFNMDIDDFENCFDMYLSNTDHKKEIFDKYKPIDVVNIVLKYLKEKDWDARSLNKREDLYEECNVIDYKNKCMICKHYDDDFDCHHFCVPYNFDHYNPKEGKFFIENPPENENVGLIHLMNNEEYDNFKKGRYSNLKDDDIWKLFGDGYLTHDQADKILEAIEKDKENECIEKTAEEATARFTEKLKSGYFSTKRKDTRCCANCKILFNCQNAKECLDNDHNKWIAKIDEEGRTE